MTARPEEPLSFSVVVPTSQRPDALRATLTALVSLDFPPHQYEVIVVDDAASATTPEVIRGLPHHHVDVKLESQDRGGAARARNRGARSAEGDVLLFVDDDIVVEPDHLTRHSAVRARHADPLVGGAWEFTPTVREALEATSFGRYRLELERGFQAGALGPVLADGCHEMTSLPSTDLALRRELFWEVGGFDERFPVAGAEDQDFSLRARGAGCLLLLDPEIRCLHNDNRLTLRAYCEREERSAKTMPFLARNYPAQFEGSAYIRENRPIASHDPPGLIAKKLAKSLLARQPILDGLHRLTGVAERAGTPDGVLKRLYRLLLGLHLFRGFRSTWPSSRALSRPDGAGDA